MGKNYHQIYLSWRISELMKDCNNVQKIFTNMEIYWVLFGLFINKGGIGSVKVNEAHRFIR